MVYTPFTRTEVELIFRLSEQQGGHAGARHVNLPSDDLWNRVEGYKGSGLAARTSFLTFADQISATLEILNDPANAADVEQFRVAAKASDKGAFEMKDRPLSQPMQMRYGIGGSASTFPCSLVTLILRKRAGNPRDMHIVTCFGSMGRMI